jgi:ABC-type Na+ efflux pump permease subunit
LGAFTKKSQFLQRQRDKYSRSPFFLLTGGTKSEFTEAAIKSSREKAAESGRGSLQAHGSGSTLDAPVKKGGQTTATAPKQQSPPPLPQSFVDRYESEVAPPAKLKEYQSIASKHKSILLKESKMLQAQYSEDLREAHKMEITVTQISSYLAEFVQILHSQRDAVEDIHSASKTATQHVKQTDSELTTTIERTESHQRSIVILVVGLALLLLLLDFVTP